ncbi:acyltransferase family protein [Paracoccus zhejiangensis]|uniref:Acyltransferase 3 domain-containing protein n=1 Tax=Paracoccus zhejiangensis TaxID=1077935 RepID=A0A2H5EZJ3_9RHOB|nr:acyltransferase [Paracoccus zhejiangensis]AUH64711.1 hypothetical protein CX676_11490 [Paracoccus zhejiangensis]
MTRSPTAKLDIIEALRFFAAMSVVFVHIPTVRAGHFGVDAFFIISGFVMMLSTRVSGEQFFLKRLIRIVPTYWLFTLGVFAIALVLPGLLNNTTANVEHLLKSLAFIPFDKNGAGHLPVLFLGWTLNYEMYFYLVFAIALTISHRYRAPLAALGIFAVWLIGAGSDSFPLQVYHNFIVYEFVLGMLVYLLLAERSLDQAAMLVAILLLAAALSDDSFAHRFYIFGLPAAVLIALALIMFADKTLPPLLLTLGGASYALYLTHPYVIQVFDKVTHWFSGTPTQQMLALVLSLVLVNLLAVAVYLLLERPLRDHLRRKLLRPRRQTRDATG